MEVALETILIPLRESLKNLDTPIRLLVEQASQQLALFERTGRRVDHQAAENALSQSVARIERAVHATWLEGLVIDAPEVVIDGQQYRRVLDVAHLGGHCLGGEARFSMRT